RRLDDKIGPEFIVLASPNELRIQVPVAPFDHHFNRLADMLVHHSLVLDRRNVLARCPFMHKRFDASLLSATHLSSSFPSLQLGENGHAIPRPLPRPFRRRPIPLF